MKHPTQTNLRHKYFGIYSYESGIMKTKTTPTINPKTLRKRICKPVVKNMVPEHLHSLVTLEHSSLFIPLD